jgi:hypothetical protein
MGYQIRYTDTSGRPRIHEYSGSEGGAKGWAETLSRENGCKAEAVYVSNGVYPDLDGPRGTVRHVITVGDDKPRR